MARPKRKKIEFTEESLNELFQEVYNDSFNIKSKINRLFIQWEAKIKDEGSIAGLGDQITNLIKAEAKNQDQKIMILKYLKEVVFKEGNNNSQNDGENVTLDENTKRNLRSLVNENKF